MPRKITAVAKKLPSGKVVTTPIGNRHKDIAGKGEHGFIASGKFEGRKSAAKIATTAGQTKHPTTRLHSTNLRSKSK